MSGYKIIWIDVEIANIGFDQILIITVGRIFPRIILDLSKDFVSLYVFGVY